MGAILLIIDMILQQGESMTIKSYGNRHSYGSMFFNAMICFFSMVFFIITDKGGLTFNKDLVAYGLLSCVMFATGFYTMYLAFQLGSFVASKLLSSFSVVIAMLYGIWFLKEPASVITWIAFGLFIISMIMVNYRKTEESEKKSFSYVWLICVLLSAVSNGCITILLRQQQIKFEGAYDNEFMILSLGGAFLFLTIISLIKESGRMLYILKNGTLYGLVAGAFNGGRNFITFLLYMFIPVSIATALRTGLGFILSFLISVLIYKEKFTKLQMAGVVIGIVSLVMFKM